MSNILDIEPLRIIAARASAKIGDADLAKRYTRIALARMIEHPSALRPATKDDLEHAPAWAIQAFESGAELSVYRRNAALAARINIVAQRIADTRTVAASDLLQRPDGAAIILEARRFLAKFDRVNFDTAARKALIFSRALATWRDNDDARPLCEAQSLVLLSGAIWHRITSLSELRRIGVEFRNCLARATSAGGYGAYLKRGQAQFWVLRNLDGRGLMVVMTQAPLAKRFNEVKGPGNARIAPDHAALIQLGVALGVQPPPPPPPPPPRPPSVGISPAVLAARTPCRCRLCDPLYVRAPRLRRSGSAP